MQSLTRFRLLAVALAAIVVAGGVLGYLARQRFPIREVDRGGYDQHGDRVQTVEAGRLPLFAGETGSKAREAYGFASSEQGRTLEWIPCHCGCSEIGHRHNRDCYLKTLDPRGVVTYTSHAAT